MLGRERYYVDEGRGHDYLLRCKDCQSLVTFETIQRLGCCGKCGTKRFMEITLLQDQEMADIQSGVIDFPGRELFLKEFSAVSDAPPKPTKFVVDEEVVLTAEELKAYQEEAE